MLRNSCAPASKKLTVHVATPGRVYRVHLRLHEYKSKHMRVAHGCPILGCITFPLSTWARSPHQLVWTLQIPCAWWHRSFGTSAANHAWCTMMYHNMEYLSILKYMLTGSLFEKSRNDTWHSGQVIYRTCWKWTMFWRSRGNMSQSNAFEHTTFPGPRRQESWSMLPPQLVPAAWSLSSACGRIQSATICHHHPLCAKSTCFEK